MHEQIDYELSWKTLDGVLMTKEGPMSMTGALVEADRLYQERRTKGPVMVTKVFTSPAGTEIGQTWSVGEKVVRIDTEGNSLNDSQSVGASACL